MRNKVVNIDYIPFLNENYYKISNSDRLRPFFMTIVSDSNHWLFISSNGALTAGRKNSEYALFPYYTDDKITESAEITGSKTIFRVSIADQNFLWEPFSLRFDGHYKTSRNLYKSEYGNKLVFEEINHDLNLTFRYQWNSSNYFGFVRRAQLINNSNQQVTIEMIDGIQNILPYGVPSSLQSASSNLVDAYKKSELEKPAHLGIYALSAIIVDKAEPSEALKANIAWSWGFINPTILLSSLQLNNFRAGLPIQEEIDIRAEKGAYFINEKFLLDTEETKEWMIIANVNQDHSGIAELIYQITNDKELDKKVQEDIHLGTQKLFALCAASDGVQLTADHYRDSRHFSNTLFNIMRGGIFDHNYDIEKSDFMTYMQNANTNSYEKVEPLLHELEEVFQLSDLYQIAMQSDDADLRRLCLEYLPLRFSRRHGDPSRPWNKFSINTHSEIDGSKILDYEGNWRDIFQNWEALAHSYPNFMENMIHKFLNASTFDGYNPYRVTKSGFDWETIEPDDPWSYIGYWGDHQIIYLLKFLEFIQDHQPGKLESLFNQDVFVYANVPYKIKSYHEILNNPKDTIEFDEKADEEIRELRKQMGADGALLQVKKEIYHVNFIEKILATALAKLSNFIPEGGIWMNTQRPEWNDANNALVGNGVSMVTLYYLRRFFKFFQDLFETTQANEFEVSEEVAEFFQRIYGTFKSYKGFLSSNLSDMERKLVLDGVGQAGSDYRIGVYKVGFSGEKEKVKLDDLKDFVSLTLQYLEHSIEANKRKDNLYHAYNLMTVKSEDEVSIAYLSEMLEGQVAVLSSGYLSATQALKLLDGLKSSVLFRPDQFSYILYPNKTLPRFMHKNTVPESNIKKSKLLTQLIEESNLSIVEKDVFGYVHFNGNFRNADDLKKALAKLDTEKYGKLIKSEQNVVLAIFEEIFNHKAFTGRSGTFYGYEGLGSIYWHMVSKLQLAVQEVCLSAIENKESDETVGRLLEHYYEINEGIGVHKSPELYGAFPTDAYSHTPGGKGAQQPGMTGQVKEDILSRFGELGVFVKEGELVFNPVLLRKTEFLKKPATFDYTSIDGQNHVSQLKEQTLAFTYCQVPIVYEMADHDQIILDLNGESHIIEGLNLNEDLSKRAFGRTNEIKKISVKLNANHLK